MAWLAVDEDGACYVYKTKPIRYTNSLIPGNGYWYYQTGEEGYGIPKWTLYAILGRKLTWNDEPVEIREYS
jgi:hypothetical protein